ncbi:MAG: hypothetical protein HY869_17835 [Chloroflexi bacterium]|nr:hypothetical protein [Chloroflexota bacterium]
MQKIWNFIGTREKLTLLLTLMTLGLALIVPAAYSHTYLRDADALSDYYQHLRWAKALQQHGPDGIPAFVQAHSAWERLLVFLNQTLGLSFEGAGFVATVAFAELTLLVLVCWYWTALAKGHVPAWKVMLAALGVGMAAPVSLLWPLDGLLYLGYIGMNVYHSPTMFLLKPLAILQFMYALCCFSEEHRPYLWQVAATALLSALGTFIKPSLAICILPALVFYAAYRLWRKAYVHTLALFFGVGLPTALVLAWQFGVTYYANEAGGIGLLPFGVMGAFSNYLGLKFLLSILFPLSVSILFFKQARGDVRLVLGWLVFLFGAVFTYFFAENERLLEGNFIWSGQITLLLLFAVSTLFYLEVPKRTQFERRFPALLWALHIVSGVVYYVVCVLGNPYI